MNISLSREENVIINLEYFAPQTIIFHTPPSKGLPLISFLTSMNLSGSYQAAAPSYISSFLLSWLTFRFFCVASEVISSY